MEQDTGDGDPMGTADRLIEASNHRFGTSDDALGTSDDGIDLDDVTFRGQALDLASLSAGLEEVREHIAAAFDAVRDLSKEVARLPEATKAIARFVEELGGDVEELGRKVDDVGPTIDLKLAGVTGSVESGLAEVSSRLERIGKVGPALTDLVEWMTGVAERQDRHEAALTKLAEELHSTRRRAPLQARAPALGTEQLDEIVDRVLAGLGSAPAPRPVGRSAQPQWEPELPVREACQAQAEASTDTAEPGSSEATGEDDDKPKRGRLRRHK